VTLPMTQSFTSPFLSEVSTMTTPLFSIHRIESGKSAFSGRNGLCVRFSRRGDDGPPRLVTITEFLGFLKLETSAGTDEQSSKPRSKDVKTDAAN